MGPCFRRDDAAYGAVAPRIFIDSNFKQGHLQPRLRDLAASFARGLLKNVPPPEDQRAQGMPGARCTRSLVCKKNKHTSIVTTVTPERPGIPRAMVLRLTSRSPR